EYYRELEPRIMADIDILVKPETLDYAVDTLEGHGWRYTDARGKSKNYWMKYGQHMQMGKKDSHYSIDLHFKLVTDSSPMNVDDSIWDDKRQIKSGKNRCNVLSPENLAINTCIAYGGGGFFHTTPLRYLLDIKKIVSKEKKFDWIKFMETCTRWNCQAFAYKSLDLSEKILGAKIQEDVIETLKSASSKKHLIYVNKVHEKNIFKDYLSSYTIKDYIYELYLSPNMIELGRLMLRPLTK
ncbi:MAG: nucleotidyltransferase family protein, partial [Candidatus Altiarchaeota archaeon]|nr:nucleotidyltransferase family protein [Candidatus Altiarchaeota archaeon]